MSEEKTKKSLFESPLLRTKIKSANVSFWETTIGYLVGPIGGLLASGILAYYLMADFYPNVFFATEKATSADAVNLFLTLLPLLSAVVIVAGNLLLGRLIEHVNTKAGKARPFILLSAVLIPVATILLFLVPEFGLTFKCIWAAVTYNLYYSLAYPLYNTATSALVSASTRNGKQRDLLSGSFNLSITASVGVAGMAFPILKGILPDSSSSTFWLILAITVGAVSLVATILQYFFTRERVTEEEMTMPKEKSNELSLGAQFKAVSKDSFWWLILGIFFIFEFSGQIMNTSMNAFCTSGSIDNSMWINMGLAADDKSAGEFTMSMLNILGAIPMALAGVIAVPVLKKFNKKIFLAAGFISGFVGGLIQIIGSQYAICIVLGFLFKQLGRGPACLFVLSLISDVLDHDEAKNGFRCATLTMSVYSALRIICQPLGQGVFNGLNSFEGGSKISFIYVDTIVYAVAFVLILFLTVEKFIAKDQETILENQKAAVLAAGGEWVEPAERMRREQEEQDRIAEENRIAELKATCEKKGLNFDEEEAKYQAKLAEQAKKAEEKKAAAEAKKANKK